MHMAGFFSTWKQSVLTPLCPVLFVGYVLFFKCQNRWHKYFYSGLRKEEQIFKPASSFWYRSKNRPLMFVFIIGDKPAIAIVLLLKGILVPSPCKWPRPHGPVIAHSPWYADFNVGVIFFFFYNRFMHVVHGNIWPVVFTEC